jgi:hemerythrin-like metal-binding protein
LRSACPKIAASIKFLEWYVVEHFQLERRLMIGHGYPGLDAHKSEHEWLISEVAAMREELDSTGPTTALVIRVNGQVCGWLRTHIAGTDLQMARFLRAAQAAR